MLKAKRRLSMLEYVRANLPGGLEECEWGEMGKEVSAGRKAVDWALWEG